MYQDNTESQVVVKDNVLMGRYAHRIGTVLYHCRHSTSIVGSGDPSLLLAFLHETEADLHV